MCTAIKQETVWGIVDNGTIAVETLSRSFFKTVRYYSKYPHGQMDRMNLLFEVDEDCSSQQLRITAESYKVTCIVPYPHRVEGNHGSRRR